MIFLFGVTGCAGNRQRLLKVKKPEATPAASESPTPSATERIPGPISFKGTSLQSRDGNKKNWVLTASEIKYDEDTQTTEAQVVEVQFYNAANEKVLTITARGAQVDMKTRSLHFRGEVLADSSDGEKMEVKKLRWDGVNKRLIGEGGIRITRKDAVMTARKMSADPEMKEIKLYDNVEVIYPEADRMLKY